MYKHFIDQSKYGLWMCILVLKFLMTWLNYNKPPPPSINNNNNDNNNNNNKGLY